MVSRVVVCGGCVWKQIVDGVTFECLLKKRGVSNGAAVIVARSLLTAVLICSTALVLRNISDPQRIGIFDYEELRAQIGQGSKWFAAIFAGVYTALYTRFSSQWTYLAELYNKIKAAECANADGKALAEWKAGYIEDAGELHLIAKPSFSPVVCNWGKDDEVRKAFICHTPGGEKRYNRLMGIAREACARRDRYFRQT